jgi:hypothetical protein
MIKRLLALVVLSVMMTGCYMVPMALVGPAMSGYSTASLLQTGVTTGANFVVKKSTGKSITEHAIASFTKDITEEIMQQTYFPSVEPSSSKTKVSEVCKKFDFYCMRMVNKNPGLAKSFLPKVKIDTGCKKHDYYCKRISRKEWLQHIKQDKSLLGSS